MMRTRIGRLLEPEQDLGAVLGVTQRTALVSRPAGAAVGLHDVVLEALRAVGHDLRELAPEAPHTRVHAGRRGRRGRAGVEAVAGLGDAGLRRGGGAVAEVSLRRVYDVLAAVDREPGARDLRTVRSPQKADLGLVPRVAGGRDGGRGANRVLDVPGDEALPVLLHVG